MSDVLSLREQKIELESRHAANGRFFDALPIPPSTLGVVENYESIQAASVEARAKLNLYEPEDFADYDKVMKVGKLPADEVMRQKVVVMNSLVSKVDAMTDASSVIERAGSQVADYFVEHYSVGLQVIGDRVYSIRKTEDRKYLCVVDDEKGLEVYFNRHEQFKEFGARSAGLRDYLNLLRDLQLPGQEQ